MDAFIFRIIGIAAATALLALALKKDAPVFAALMTLAGSVIIFFMVAPRLAAFLSMLQAIGENVGEGGVYIATVLRVIGIAYASEFGANICADADEAGLAGKVEFAGKILILAASAPVITALLQQILQIF